jgi:HEAT repeat protein
MARQTRQQAAHGDLVKQLGTVVDLLQESVRAQDEDEKAADKLEAKADKLEKKLDKLEAKLDKLEKKADGIETKCDNLEKKCDKAEQKLDKLEKKVDDQKKRGAGSSGGLFVSAPRLNEIRERLALGRSETLALAATFRQPPMSDLARTGDDDKDQTEARLDRNEENVDKEEKARDGQEAALDALEKKLDAWEKDLDSAEKDFDQAEKLLDEPGSGDKKRTDRTSPLAAEPSSPAPALFVQTCPDADERLVSALVTDLRKGGVRSRRAARQLERLGAAATPGLLRAYDTAAEEHFRWELVNLLGYTRDARAIPLLAERGIQDHELHPRWRSIWALSSVDDGSAPARLRAEMARSTGVRRRNLAVALSLFEDPAAVPALRRGLRAKDAWIRWESASCLAGYSDKRTARALLSLYDGEGDMAVRKEMLRALAGVQSAEVVGFLKVRLRDGDPSIRSLAAASLVRCANGQAARLLKGRLRRERNHTVRKDIRNALASLAAAPTS